MTLRGLTTTALLSIACSACSISDDIWFPPEDSGGKADAFTTIRGADIPSQYVDPTKSYLLSRRIDSLTNAGAIDAVQTRLAQRSDGIIANLPSDGRLHLAELVRMEHPSVYDTLFDDEAAALPELWKRLEAPSAAEHLVGPDVSLGVLDTSIAVGAAVPPASLLITSLPANTQSAATRLQNIYNADNNAATVMIGDVDKGIANPGPFTQTEIGLFGLIRKHFIEKAVALGTATVVISPGPGRFDSQWLTLGPLGLRIQGATAIQEERVLDGSLSVRLTAMQTASSMASLMSADMKTIVIHKASQSETVFGTGAVPPLGGAGDSIVEVWMHGDRVFSTNVVLPETSRQQMIDLSDKLDYALYRGTTPLVRNAVSAESTGSKTVTTFTYDQAVVQPMVTPNQVLLKRTATPTVAIPVGRYSFPQQQVTLLVYPNNVLWLQRSGQLYRMFPSPYSGAVTRFKASAIDATFDTTNNELRLSSPSLDVLLDASERDI